MRILSINLCVSWTTPRKARLRALADFVRAEQIDVLLVQEGIRSCFVYDTIRQLARELGYDYFAKSTFGWPLFWEFRVGVISRLPILHTYAWGHEVKQTSWVDAIPLPWRRRAAAVTVEPPGLGYTHLISVHLTSAPANEGERNEQMSGLLDWIKGLDFAALIVLGGDFNLSREKEAYRYPRQDGFLESGASVPDFI